MNQTNSNLPESVARYIEASNNFDAQAASACFATDASVRDMEQDIVGIKAIESWVAESSAKYQPQATVTRVQNEGENVAITVDVAGQFPGSPVELEFDFHLRQGKIAQLTIR